MYRLMRAAASVRSAASEARRRRRHPQAHGPPAGRLLHALLPGIPGGRPGRGNHPGRRHCPGRRPRGRRRGTHRAEGGCARGSRPAPARDPGPGPGRGDGRGQHRPRPANGTARRPAVLPARPKRGTSSAATWIPQAPAEPHHRGRPRPPRGPPSEGLHRPARPALPARRPGHGDQAPPHQPQDRQGRDEDRLRGHQPPARTGRPGTTRRTRTESLVS